MTTARDPAHREFRPSLATYRRVLRSPARLAGLLLSLAVLAAGTASGGPGILVLVPLSLLVVAVLLGAWLATGRVWVSERAVVRRGALGRRRTVLREDLASALLLTGFHERGDRPSGLLVLLDARRRPLLRLTGTWWGLDQLREVAHACGVPVTLVEGDLTPGELVWRRPYDLPWHHRHPVAAQLAVAVPAVALLVGGTLLLSDG
ncbi:hypothetical protein [Geodermatophilus normandii]|uniref:Uncharacterized protein n=1 Tax=Geodermatophilus normandii TaxID=1137989 RepID=A0A6P0GM30_9ACTN|nr:hypothetical protein [Geodermatophilus normandii]NEM06665.1 hypothetical protein [Geodermatophilus normandii]NEM08389.1 hypothetical protein [Geodermatophilus normandii]